jgi:ABC-type transport system involved in cytochrome c biogenesis permease subunit
MNPQVTNLVPVLNSYWLSIHVSMITASYGFLGLGALLGFITLMLFVLKNDNDTTS